ncbi:MAG: HD-GYP domain-containing protein [Armatimonadetes bacterium]|nr:HD-GYP domain-containing protein [Armatimonadota bacterium]
MRRVPVALLRPGMKVGRALYSSREELLLNAGTILTARNIERLKTLKIPALYVDDGFLGDVAVDDVITGEIRIRAIAQVRELMQEQDAPSMGVGRAILKVRQITETVENIIDQLLANRSLVVNLVDIRAIDDYTFGHCVNVCVLSLLTGITLGYNREKLLRLGMGAILHDIGKAAVPGEILNKAGRLTEEEFIIIKQHPEQGYRTVLKMPGISPASAQVVYQHHERYNGSGYPLGLKEREVHEFAYICGVADVFDALTADRVYRKACPVHEAYEMVAGSGNHLFDFRVVKAFLENIAAYPVGTWVRLSTGEIGLVTENRRGYPLYPRVRVFFDGSGSPVEPFELSLGEHREVAIDGVVEEGVVFSDIISLVDSRKKINFP